MSHESMKLQLKCYTVQFAFTISDESLPDKYALYIYNIGKLPYAVLITISPVYAFNLVRLKYFFGVPFGKEDIHPLGKK